MINVLVLWYKLTKGFGEIQPFSAGQQVDLELFNSTQSGKIKYFLCFFGLCKDIFVYLHYDELWNDDWLRKKLTWFPVYTYVLKQ